MARLYQWIDDHHTCSIEVASVEGRNRQIVCQRSGGDEAVLDRHCAPLCAKCREQLSPAQSRGCLPRYALQPPYSVVEPALEPASSTAAGEQQDTEANLTEDDRVHGELRLIVPEPIDDTLVGGGLGRLREDVRVNQIARQSDQPSESVDSDSISTNQPSSGHDRSHSTKPRFGGGVCRVSRYSSGPIRSTSNSSPALMPSAARNSAGRTIWPFVEMVVRMRVR